MDLSTRMKLEAIANELLDEAEHNLKAATGFELAAKRAKGPARETMLFNWGEAKGESVAFREARSKIMILLKRDHEANLK
jgi:hypothetical protein